MWLLILILAMAFTAVMLGIAAFAVVTVAVHVLPWLLILAGVWLLVRAIWGPRRRHGPAPVHQAPPRPWDRPAPAPTADAQRGPRDQTRRPSSRRKLPPDVREQADRVRRKAHSLLGDGDRFPPFSRDLHLVRQTIAEYLPRTVNAYLAVPGDDDPVVATTGRTALEEVRAQLDLLEARLDAIARNLQRQDLDHLAANRRFLEERFAEDVPPPPHRPRGEGTDAA